MVELANENEDYANPSPETIDQVAREYHKNAPWDRTMYSMFVPGSFFGEYPHRDATTRKHGGPTIKMNLEVLNSLSTTSCYKSAVFSDDELLKLASRAEEGATEMQGMLHIYHPQAKKIVYRGKLTRSGHFINFYGVRDVKKLKYLDIKDTFGEYSVESNYLSEKRRKENKVIFKERK